MYSHCSLARVLAIKACKPLGVFTKIIRLKDFDSMVYGSRVYWQVWEKETENEYVRRAKKLVDELGWFYLWVRVEENVMKCMK